MAEKIITGDEIIVIHGRNKGARGTVRQNMPREDRMLVEGVNIVRKHMKRGRRGARQVGIIEVEAVGTNGIIAKLATSNPQRCLAESAAEHWLIDPVIVDSGLQLLILWSRTHLDMTPLPARLGCYHYFGPMPRGEVRCEVAVRNVAGTHPFMPTSCSSTPPARSSAGWRTWKSPRAKLSTA